MGIMIDRLYIVWVSSPCKSVFYDCSTLAFPGTWFSIAMVKCMTKHIITVYALWLIQYLPRGWISSAKAKWRSNDVQQWNIRKEFGVLIISWSLDLWNTPRTLLSLSSSVKPNWTSSWSTQGYQGNTTINVPGSRFALRPPPHDTQQSAVANSSYPLPLVQLILLQNFIITIFNSSSFPSLKCKAIAKL